MAERLLVVRGHAHDDRHHAADRAGDIIAVSDHLLLVRRLPVALVELEPFEMIVEEALGNWPLTEQLAERLERQFVHLFTRDRAMGLVAQRRDVAGLAPAEAEHLAVAHVIAMAAPGVEHPRPLARRSVEQPAGRAERLRPVVDRVARTGDDLVACHCPRSASIRPAVALALPTTPGMPAPGCVPAPTK